MVCRRVRLVYRVWRLRRAVVRRVGSLGGWVVVMLVDVGGGGVLVVVLGCGDGGDDGGGGDNGRYVDGW